jgi:glycerol-3-phosphate dehydrogenase
VASDAIQVDVLIFGGGVAGLWTLARLRALGFACLLVEKDALGAGQTIASQGIIHGGIKYALTGRASRASAAIAGMPAIWEACLAGRGEIDLRSARVLSERQYLWTTSGIGSRLVGAAVGRVVRTPVRRVRAAERPECFAGAGRGVDVYTVEERVLEPRSVVHALAETAGGEGIVRCGAWEVADDAIRLRGVMGDVLVRPRRVVLCAGEGNAALMEHLHAGTRSNGKHGVGQQVRPLHMVMARGDLPEVYGHCVGVADRPRLTITSQVDAEGRVVWYVGGEVAEAGVDRPAEEQIAAARGEIAACLGWVDLADTQWAAVRVNRAEGTIGGAGGKIERPDEPVIVDLGGEFGTIVAYPTKLAFSPLLAERVIELVRGTGGPASPARKPLGDAFTGFERPTIAPLPWERAGAGGVQWR